jgi:cysteinyl-tRNA synthetase
MTLHFYNTESRILEPFRPIVPGKVKMYTCGPTVYDFAHIGNFRTYVFEDILRRTLKYFGYEVEQVMNLTDLDDKTIKGSIKENKTLKDTTAPYIKAFFEDREKLNLEKVEHFPAATDYIQQMIDMIEALLKKGIAYRSEDGCVYYSIVQFPGYGRLSHLPLENLKPCASDRINHDEYDKDNVSDFVLWKAYDPERDGKVFWDSPYGLGRPGWHLECSAMAIDLLGESIDIHCGGIDNMFPHHENEIAQSEACTGHHFVNYWLHSEHLQVNGKKMSKSLGNFFTLRDLFEKGFSGIQVRYLLMATHYRMQLNFTFNDLEGAKSALGRFYSLLNRLADCKDDGINPGVDDRIAEAKEQFDAGLADDLNISVSLAGLFDFIHEINTQIDQKKISHTDAKKITEFLRNCDKVLGVIFVEEDKPVPEEVLEMARKRDDARKAKNWAEADRFRNEIIAKGWAVQDTPNGTKVIKE